jgi:hypothetical protein
METEIILPKMGFKQYTFIIGSGVAMVVFLVGVLFAAQTALGN